MGPPTTITGPWRALVDHAGGITALANELTVHRATLHRWLAGTHAPSPIVQAAVNSWAKRRGLDAPW